MVSSCVCSKVVMMGGSLLWGRERGGNVFCSGFFCFVVVPRFPDNVCYLFVFCFVDVICVVFARCFLFARTFGAVASCVCQSLFLLFGTHTFGLFVVVICWLGVGFSFCRRFGRNRARLWNLIILWWQSC